MLSSMSFWLSIPSFTCNIMCSIYCTLAWSPLFWKVPCHFYPDPVLLCGSVTARIFPSHLRGTGTKVAPPGDQRPVPCGSLLRACLEAAVGCRRKGEELLLGPCDSHTNGVTRGSL